MGCRQVENKRNDRIQVVRASSNNGMTHTGPVASFNFLIRYKGQDQGMVTYPVNAKVHTLVRDMVSKVPYSSPDNKYQFQINGRLVAADLKSDIVSIAQIREALNSGGAPLTGNGKLHEIIVDVICLGLDNIPTDVIKAYNNTRFIAKPLNEPFEIAVFDRNCGMISTEELTREVELNSEIALFSDLSAYCNGDNFLYLSGGETKSNETLNHFWIIDLSKKTIRKHSIGLKHPRKFHSMVYIPNSYVFIVGGLGVKKVEYYDIRTQEMVQHSTLNEERTEPALVVVNNSYLYAFTGFYTNHGRVIDTFERFNLREHGHWELIKPKISRSLGNFTQKFFAVSHHRINEVIFLGGSRSEDDRTNKPSCIYDYSTNELKPSSVPFAHIEFSEKFFYPFKGMDSFLIPMLNDRNGLSIIGYTQDNFTKISFEPDLNLSSTEQEKFSCDDQGIKKEFPPM